MRESIAVTILSMDLDLNSIRYGAEMTEELVSYPEQLSENLVVNMNLTYR